MYFDSSSSPRLSKPLVCRKSGFLSFENTSSCGLPASQAWVPLICARQTLPEPFLFLAVKFHAQFPESVLIFVKKALWTPQLELLRSSLCDFQLVFCLLFLCISESLFSKLLFVTLFPRHTEAKDWLPSQARPTPHLFHARSLKSGSKSGNNRTVRHSMLCATSDAPAMSVFLHLRAGRCAAPHKLIFISKRMSINA